MGKRLLLTQRPLLCRAVRAERPFLSRAGQDGISAGEGQGEGMGCCISAAEVRAPNLSLVCFHPLWSISGGK